MELNVCVTQEYLETQAASLKPTRHENDLSNDVRQWTPMKQFKWISHFLDNQVATVTCSSEGDASRAKHKHKKRKHRVPRNEPKNVSDRRKTCNFCRLNLSIDRFYRHTDSFDGYMSTCIDCAQARRKTCQQEKELIVLHTKKLRFCLCAHCLNFFEPGELHFSSATKSLHAIYRNPCRIPKNQLLKQLADGWFLCRICWDLEEVKVKQIAKQLTTSP